MSKLHQYFLEPMNTLTHDAKRMWLNRLDHAAILLLIAGTYIPIAYNLFPARWRWPSLIIIWLAVILGALYKLFSARSQIS